MSTKQGAIRAAYDQPYLLLILTMLAWGGNAVASRLAVGEISPMLLTAGRWSLVLAIVGVLGRDAIARNAPRLREQWRPILAMGVCGFTAFNADNFFTKWDGPDSNKPSYVTCVSSCTTVEYKAYTRKHIEEDLGYDIVLNIGDQWSDLQGGYANAVLKLPNPTYYLPSPNLPGVSEPQLAPRTEFTMKPDGSSAPFKTITFKP